MDRFFTLIATQVSRAVGQPFAFVAAMGIMCVWGVTGPVFGYSDTWQLVINTGTTIITFLMVFVIQNSQNRDAAAMQAKLDELIRTQQDARNAVLAPSRGEPRGATQACLEQHKRRCSTRRRLDAPRRAHEAGAADVAQDGWCDERKEECEGHREQRQAAMPRCGGHRRRPAAARASRIPSTLTRERKVHHSCSHHPVQPPPCHSRPRPRPPPRLRAALQAS